MNAELMELLAATLSDDDICEGLDPILAAHLKERMEAQPHLRRPLAGAALGRAVGGEDDA